jgi:hypothetical protein
MVMSASEDRELEREDGEAEAREAAEEAANH